MSPVIRAQKRGVRAGWGAASSAHRRTGLCWRSCSAACSCCLGRRACRLRPPVAAPRRQRVPVTLRCTVRRLSGESTASGWSQARRRSGAASPSPSTTGLTRAGRPGSRRLLRRLGVPATFFVVGEHVIRYPSLVATLQSDGFELGDHTFNHVDLTTIPGWERHLQVSMTDTAIAGAAGVRPRFFRPAVFGRSAIDQPRRGGGAGLDSRSRPPDRALQLRLGGLAPARCLEDRAQRDTPRAPGGRPPLPRRGWRSLADGRRPPAPGAAP